MSPLPGYLDPGLPSGPQTSRSILDVHADTPVVNSAVLTALAALAIPRTVGAGDSLRLLASGDLLNNSGGAANFTFTVAVGATTVATLGAFSVSASAARRDWMVELDILLAATNDERCLSRLLISGAAAAAVSQNGFRRGTAAIDLTAGANLTLSVTMGTAAATIDCFLHEAVLLTSKR